MSAGVVIVGGGLAGVRTAQALRSLGFDGRIRILAGEQRLPYDRPPLSKELLSGAVHEPDVQLLPHEEYHRLGIELTCGARASAVDLRARELTLANGGTVRWETLVIATGARPRRLAQLAEVPSALTLRTIDDALALRAQLQPGRELVIVGGGFVGLEVAASAVQLGCRATVLEAQPQPLAAALGEQLGGSVADWHRSHGAPGRRAAPRDRALDAGGRPRAARRRRDCGQRVGRARARRLLLVGPVRRAPAARGIDRPRRRAEHRRGRRRGLELPGELPRGRRGDRRVRDEPAARLRARATGDAASRRMSVSHPIAHDLAIEQRTLPAIWARRVRASAEGEPFLWHPGRPIASVQELDGRIAETAAGLARLGIGAGDRVCLLMDNSPEMLEAMIALWSIGAIAAPLSPKLEGRLLHEKIELVQPVLIVADELRAQAVPAGVPLLIEGGPGGDRADARSLDEIREPGARRPSVDVAPEQPALILFTSGTSGGSKGCVLSHHYAAYYAWVFWRHMGYDASDTLYTCLPLSHCHALFSSFWPAVLAGARIAISPRFSASRFWQEIEQSGTTACAAIGTMTSILLAREPDEHEAAQRVRIAHVSPDGALDMPRFEERFGCKAVTCLYGSTEAMIFPPLAEMPPVPGLIGPAPDDWEVALLDEAGFALDGEASGELVARPRLAHTMFDGYLEQPEASARALRGAWLHTEDIARRDRSGMYWFVGRRSDTIRRRGENVSSWEVERGIAEHPLVEEAAAFPVFSELNGQDVGLVAVSRAGSALDVAAIDEHCERTLPRHMRPDRVWVREQPLPKNAGGKPDKAGLRRQYAAAPVEAAGSERERTEAAGSERQHADARAETSGPEREHADARAETSGPEREHADARAETSGPEREHADARAETSGPEREHADAAG